MIRSRSFRGNRNGQLVGQGSQSLREDGMNGQESKSLRTYPATTLGDSLEKSLSAYGVAAAAAGVSLLALVAPAECRIVYTPANANIPVNGDPVSIDLNHDGTPDFSITNLQWFGSDHGEFLDWLNAVPIAQGNQIWGKGSFYASRPRHAPKGGYTSIF